MRFPIKPVKTPDSKPAAQQVWEMVNWGARLVTTPTDYISHKLYQKGKTKYEALRFLSDPRMKALQHELNQNHHLMRNKIAYDLHYSSLGLPIPRTIAVIGDPGVEVPYPQLRSSSETIDFISTHIDQGQHVVLKKEAGAQGTGVLVIIDILNVEGQEFFLLSNGATRQVQKTIAEMTTPGEVWLVQERLKQHEILNSLNSTSINTIRVGTFLNNDGSVDIDYAVLRIGREYSQIDAYAAGGVAVRIDTHTGQLAEYGQQKPKYSPDPITHHPDSKVKFSNLQIPFWDDVVHLAEKFAINAGGNRSIGWDIAISPEGPVFVEGNHAWDVHLAQTGERGLLTDEFIARLRRETTIELSATEMPMLNLSRALKLFRG